MGLTVTMSPALVHLTSGLILALCQGPSSSRWRRRFFTCVGQEVKRSRRRSLAPSVIRPETLGMVPVGPASAQPHVSQQDQRAWLSRKESTINASLTHTHTHADIKAPPPYMWRKAGCVTNMAEWAKWRDQEKNRGTLLTWWVKWRKTYLF